jgi:acyl-[acyl carrier protein]--UDP-N-acetylglucosamine O-acyltransferase
MSLFHSTAIIDKSSNIHPDAEIGPFCVIGPDVVIE